MKDARLKTAPPRGSAETLGRSTETSSAIARPMELEVGLIDEDPHQPRQSDNPGFTTESLTELASTITLRGVKTPISVRAHPTHPGRFIVNHGARRLRASLMAGKTTIPAFLDNDYTSADQVIENLQRDSLTAREIADYIGRELAKGKKKGEIATALGKSPSYVSQHVTLLDLPDPIAALFTSGRCRDVTLINELVTIYKAAPKEVTAWVEDASQDITRGTVALLRGFITEQQGQADPDKDPQDEADESMSVEQPVTTRSADPNRLTKAIVMVTHGTRQARLVLNRRAPASGMAWLKYEDDGRVAKVHLKQVQLVAIVEG